MPNRSRETVEEAKRLHEPTYLESPEDIRLAEALKLYRHELDECEAIFEDRNRIYKNTFDHLGLLGTTVTLIGDVFRLRNMIIHEPDHGRRYADQIEDKLRDVVNQAVISLMMLHQDNFEGK